MFGAVEFYYRARKHGLKPIIGCEAYIAPRGRFDRTVRDEAHVTLLAADDEGYKNLTALISKGFLEGYYYKPRIDMDLLEQHNRGLIVLSGCMSSLVAAPLLKNDYATLGEARARIRRHLRRPVLHRDHASRDARRRRHQRRADLGRARAEPAAGRDQRFALPRRAATRRRTTCCSASAPGKPSPTPAG